MNLVTRKQNTCQHPKPGVQGFWPGVFAYACTKSHPNMVDIWCENLAQIGCETNGGVIHYFGINIHSPGTVGDGEKKDQINPCHALKRVKHNFLRLSVQIVLQFVQYSRGRTLCGGLGRPRFGNEHIVHVTTFSTAFLISSSHMSFIMLNGGASWSCRNEITVGWYRPSVVNARRLSTSLPF